MLKMMLKTTTMVAAIVLATTVAHAGLICGWAQVIVGDPGRPGTGVQETDVSIDNGVWTVIHKLASGEVIDRSVQYAMRDTSNRNQTQWKGMLLGRPYLHMTGEIMRYNPTGQPSYNEWLFDDRKGGALIMHSMSLCKYDTPSVVVTPPAQPPVVMAPPPAPTTPALAPAPVPPPVRDTTALDAADKVYVQCLYTNAGAMATSSTEPAEVIVKAAIGSCNVDMLSVMAAAKAIGMSSDETDSYINQANEQAHDVMLSNILMARASGKTSS